MPKQESSMLLFLKHFPSVNTKSVWRHDYLSYKDIVVPSYCLCLEDKYSVWDFDSNEEWDEYIDKSLKPLIAAFPGWEFSMDFNGDITLSRQKELKAYNEALEADATLGDLWDLIETIDWRHYETDRTSRASLP